MKNEIQKLPPYAMVYNKLKAIFGVDPEFNFTLNSKTRTITVKSENRHKLNALKAALNLELFEKAKTNIEFEYTGPDSTTADFIIDVFKGNPHFSRAYVTYDAATGLQQTLCYFKDETIQYPVDDRFVPHGYETTLAQRLIKDLFCRDVRHMKYVTEEKPVSVNKSSVNYYRVPDSCTINKDVPNVIDPYALLYNKIVALFGEDPELEISELDDENREATITSTNKHKADALNKAFNFEAFKEQGFNLKVVYNGDSSPDVEFLNVLFTGNPHFSRVYVTYDAMGGVRNIICYFENETIQYKADDRFVPHGYETSLAQDLVAELFNAEHLEFKYITEEKVVCEFDPFRYNNNCENCRCASVFCCDNFIDDVDDVEEVD